jgi:hypothetical protein
MLIDPGGPLLARSVTGPVGERVSSRSGRTTLRTKAKANLQAKEKTSAHPVCSYKWLGGGPGITWLVPMMFAFLASR